MVGALVAMPKREPARTNAPAGIVAYPVVPWPTLRNSVVKTWQQGEHVMVNGPTGVGKTTLISRILTARKYVVVFVTKIHDDTITKDFPDFERIYEWPPKVQQNKVLLWPKPGKTIAETSAIQRRVFRKAMDKIMIERNWCLVFDEQHYVCKELGLEKSNTMFQHQGRSSGISCVNGAQRPAWIPLITLSGSTHIFLWKNTFESDMKRLSDIGGINRRELEYNMLKLQDKHQFIYVNPRTGVAVISKVTI